MHVITCCRICNCLAGDARWWLLKLVSGIGGRRGRAGVAARHVMGWIRGAVVILCVLPLAKTRVRRIVLPNQTTQESSITMLLLISHFSKLNYICVSGSCLNSQRSTQVPTDRSAQTCK